jgi:S-formylglutathione hydrolase FrmB
MFRTTEISDPKFESNHLRFITVKSKNLKGRGDICVFVPPLENVIDIPLVILLHGVYGSSWVWSQKGGVHLTAWDMMRKGEVQPMVIAMPSDGLWGDGSAYVRHKTVDYEKWIVEDVPNAVSENIKQLSKKSHMFISGLSMGGFGALRLGIKYADRFKAVSAHSSITSLEQMPLFVEEPLDNYLITEPNEQFIWGLIQQCEGNLPGIRFDCGTEDLLIDHNRLLHHQLKTNHIDHIYEEFSGAHEWPYWQEHIRDSLLFFSEMT